MQQPSAPSSTPSPSGYTLGIDIGTASVAVAAAVNGEVKAVDGLIFGDASHPRTMEPNYKAHRRKLRMSAQQDRAKGRLRRLAIAANILRESLGIGSGSEARQAAGVAWAYRSHAPVGRVGVEELLAILFHVAKHRGFAGRGEDDEDEDDPDEGKKIREGIERAEQIIAEQQAIHGDPMTFGRAMFLHFHPPGKSPKRIQTYARENKATGVVSRMTYVRRKRIEEEVDAILAAQRQWHPWLDDPIPRERFDAAARAIIRREDATADDMALVGWHYVDAGRGKAPNPLPATWAELLRGIVFSNRPRKPHLHNIGGCDYYPEERRVSAAHPLAERYRLLELVANQRWIDDGGAKVPLSPEEQAALLAVLRDGKVGKDGFVSWATIREALAKVSPANAGWRLAHQTEKAKNGLKGEVTRRVWAKHGLLDAWDALDADAQGAVIEVLADHLVSAEAVMESEAERAALRDVTLALPGGAAAWAFIEGMIATGSLALPEKLGLPKKRVSLGKTAITRLCAMIEQGDRPKDAQDKLAEDVGKDIRKQVARFHGRADDAPVSQMDVLTYLRTRQRLPQQVWRPLMYALRRIEAVTKRMGGPPTAVRFEMMRELGMGEKKRAEIVREQNANEKDRAAAQAEIEQALGRPATGRDVLRFRLWRAQRHICPYTGRTMGLAEALNAEIEHIRLDSQGGSNKLGNLLLVAPEANQARGAHPSPLLAMRAGALDRATVEQACLRIAQAIKPDIASIEDLLALASEDAQAGKKKSRKKKVEEKPEATDEVEDRRKGKDGKEGDKDKGPGLHWMLRKLARVLTWDGTLPQAKAGEDSDAAMREDSDAAMLRRFASTGHQARLLRQIMAAVWPDVTDVLCVRGEITARLRREKGLERVLLDVRRQEGLPVDPMPLPPGWSLLDARERDRIALARFDKRCDHRHHLLDAMVLATTQRGEYQEAVRRRNGEGNPASRYAPQPGQAHPLAAQARRWIDGWVMWHVPELHPNGPWFTENPPTKNGLVKNNSFGKKPKPTDAKKRAYRKSEYHQKTITNWFITKDRSGKEHRHARLEDGYACLACWPDGRYEVVTNYRFNVRPADGGATYGERLRRQAARGEVHLFFRFGMVFVRSVENPGFYVVKSFAPSQENIKLRRANQAAVDFEIDIKMTMAGVLLRQVPGSGALLSMASAWRREQQERDRALAASACEQAMPSVIPMPASADQLDLFAGM